METYRQVDQGSVSHPPVSEICRSQVAAPLSWRDIHYLLVD
jgi:hypothetical protein